MKSFLLPGMILLSTSGCASEDPSQGGFFGGLVGLGTGTYEHRVTEKTASWHADDRRYQEELDTGEALDGVIREQHYLVTNLKRQVFALEGNIMSLNDEIEALRAQETVTSRDLAAAESRVASLIANIDDLKAEQSAQGTPSDALSSAGKGLEDDEVIKLRAQIDRIDRAIADLRSRQEDR